MSEEEEWRKKLERLDQIQQRVREITDRARALRLGITEPVRARVRERVAEFLDRVAPPATQMRQTATCPSCTAEVPEGAKFCLQCGIVLTQKPKSFSGHLSVEV